MQRGCETLSRCIRGSKRRQIATATRLQSGRASPALQNPRRRQRGVNNGGDGGEAMKSSEDDCGCHGDGLQQSPAQAAHRLLTAFRARMEETV